MSTDRKHHGSIVLCHYQLYVIAFCVQVLSFHIFVSEQGTFIDIHEIERFDQKYLKTHFQTTFISLYNVYSSSEISLNEIVS